MTSVPNLRQNSFRFRVDGALVNNTPTWALAENVNFYPGLDATFRLRIACDNTGAGSTGNCVLMASQNGGAYQQVTNLSTICKTVEGVADAAGSSKVTVQRLTSGSGSFSSGGLMETSTLTYANMSASIFSEGEAVLQLLSANVSPGDTITFRVYTSGPTVGATYTQTPTITVPAADSAPSSPTTYFFDNTASDLTATGQTGPAVSKSLVTSGQSTGTWAPSLTATSGGVADSNADSSFFAAAGIPGAGASADTGKYSTVSIDITTGNTNIRYSARLIRVDSTGAVVAWGALAESSAGTTGIYTFNCSWNGLGTWNAGDRLRVDVRARNTVNSAGQTATLTYDSSSWVAFLAAPPAVVFIFPRNRKYLRR